MPHVGSSPLTRGRTRDPCVGSMEFQPLDHQGSPVEAILEVPPFSKAAFLKKRITILGLFFLPLFLPLSLSTQTQVCSTHTQTHTHKHTQSFPHWAGRPGPPTQGSCQPWCPTCSRDLVVLGGHLCHPFVTKWSTERSGRTRAVPLTPPGPFLPISGLSGQ